MKKINSITAAAALMAFAVLLSRIMGYVREMILAYHYGASTTTDAFYAAFQIPDLLNYFLAGGALSIAFIPLYHRALAKRGVEAAQNLFSIVLGTLGMTVIALTAVLFIYAEPLLRWQFPKFDDATLALCVHLTKIVLPAQIFFIIGGILQAVLLAERHFLAAALSPLVYNLCIILGGVFLHSTMGIDGFAWGTLAGAARGPLLMPLILGRKILRITPRVAFLDRQFMIYLAVAAPLMFGQTLLTVDEWLARWFGATLDAGTVAHLAYARRLIQVPVAVIGQALAAAALPTLSKLWAEGKASELNATLSRTLYLGLVLSVIAAGGMAALSQPLVEVIYQHGAFTPKDAAIVTMLVGILAFGIPGWIGQQIILRAFYAREQTLRAMVVCTLITLLSIPLYKGFADWLGVLGIAFASSLAMTVASLVIIGYARIIHDAPGTRAMLWTILRATIAVIPASLVANKYQGAWQNLVPSAEWSLKTNSFLNLAYGGSLYMITTLFIMAFFFPIKKWRPLS